MGIYINSAEMSQVQWLETNGEEIEQPSSVEIAMEENSFPVCLVDNGPFTAAGVIYDNRELEGFTLPNDLRPKRWFIVNIDDLYQVIPSRDFDALKRILKKEY